mgnify:FL=1
MTREEEIEGLDASEHGIETYPEFGGTVVDESGPRSPPGGLPTADGGEVTDDD